MLKRAVVLSGEIPSMDHELLPVLQLNVNYLPSVALDDPELVETQAAVRKVVVDNLANPLAVVDRYQDFSCVCFLCVPPHLETVCPQLFALN